MAKVTFLPVRAFNRSQKVRIGGRQLSPTRNTLINIERKDVQRDWARHSAIGALAVVGSPITTTEDGVVHGGTPSQTGNYQVTVGAGSWVRDNGTAVTFDSAVKSITDDTALTSGQARIDRVSVNSSGVVAVTAGTAAAAASAAAPAVPANSVTLALVTVTKGGTAAVVEDRRP